MPDVTTTSILLYIVKKTLLLSIHIYQMVSTLLHVNGMKTTCAEKSCLSPGQCLCLLHFHSHRWIEAVQFPSGSVIHWSASLSYSLWPFVLIPESGALVATVPQSPNPQSWWSLPDLALFPGCCIVKQHILSSLPSSINNGHLTSNGNSRNSSSITMWLEKRYRWSQ